MVNGFDDQGFAAVDAVVALAIVAAAVILSLAALRIAGRVSAVALETNKARTELRYLLDDGPRTIGTTSGRGPGFGWQVRNAPEPGVGLARAQICTRTAVLQGLATGRVYTLTTAEMCAE